VKDLSVLHSPSSNKGRIIVALLTSVALAALWLFFRLPFAILPAILAPLWVPTFLRRQPASPRSKLVLVTLVGAGLTLFLIAGVAAFVLSSN
jgi:hypothetical protein